MAENPLFAYTLSPSTVYITRDPNNVSIAKLTVGVNNPTEDDIECDWLAFVIQLGTGAGDLTSVPGQIATSSSRPDEWSFSQVAGMPGQFRAEPIFPTTGLKAGGSISFQLDNIAVNGVLGSTKFQIIERTGDRREQEKFLNKTASDLRVDYFVARPNSIKPGEQATLEWKTQSAASCTLNRAGYPAETVEVTGSRQVSPDDSANYTLNAFGVGQVQANALVSVIRVNVLDFRGPTARVAPGRSTPLSWRTEFATRCELKANGVMVDANAPLQAEQTPYWVTPTKDQTEYTLFAYDAAGKHHQKSVTVFLQPRFKLTLKETWEEEIPSKIAYIATPKSLLADPRIFAGSTDGFFYVLDSMTRKRIFSRKINDAYYFLEPSPDGKRLLSQSIMNVRILDATPGSSYPQLVIPKEPHAIATGAAYHPDGSKVYYACGSTGPGAAGESEAEEPNPAPLVKGLIFADTTDLSVTHSMRVGAVPGGTSISPDGKTLCLVEMDSAHLYLIDIATRQVTTISIGDFSGAKRIVNSVWSPDGKKIYATNSTPGTIWVVTLATREVGQISLGTDITPVLLRIGPSIAEFEEGSNILYALCGPDGTVAGISTTTNQVLSRLSLGQHNNPAFAFVLNTRTPFDWATMAVAPDGKSVYVTNPPRNSIFIIDNGGQHVFQKALREGVELDGTVFDYVVSPNTVYITRDPHNPSIARLDIGVINATGSDMECDWISFIVIPGDKPGALTADPSSITPSSSRPDEWSITPIQGAPGQFRAEPIFPTIGLNAGDSISFQLSNIVVNGELGGTNFDVVELVSEPRQRACPINKIRGDLNIDFFRGQPSAIRPGATTKLSWKTAGAASCILSWPTGSEWVSVTGSKEVQPSDTTIYTLTAHGGLGPDVSAQTAIVVNRVVIVLEASPIAVGLDGSSVLNWHVLNSDPDTCRLNPGDIQVEPVGEKLVTLNRTTPFTLSANGGSSFEFKQVMISVETPVIRFFRSTTPAKPGDPVTLSWDTQYAKSVSIDRGVGGVPPVGSTVVANVDETTYTLTCLGLGEPVKAAVAVPGNKVRIHSLHGICIDNEFACNNLFFGVRYACIWQTSFATSTRLIKVSTNQVVATQSGEFNYFIWAPANRPQEEYRLVAEGPGGPAIQTVLLGWML